MRPMLSLLMGSESLARKGFIDEEARHRLGPDGIGSAAGWCLSAVLPAGVHRRLIS